MTDTQAYVREMAKLWFGKLVDGEPVNPKPEDYILIETAKLVEAGTVSNKTGREVTKIVMGRGWRKGIADYFNSVNDAMVAAK